MSAITRFYEVMGRLSRYTPGRIHSWLYRRTGGKLGASMPGGKLKVLLLTTTGRKSGLPRTHPAMYYRAGENFVIIASNSGADQPPQWYLNLKHCAQAVVQVEETIQPVEAQEAGPEERARLWPILTGLQPVFAAYQSFTTRQIPVIILRPVQPAR